MKQFAKNRNIDKAKSRKQRELMINLVWLVFLLILLTYFIFLRIKISQAKKWKKTKGEIISCEWKKELHTLWPKIKYEYTVQGDTYTSINILFDTTHSTAHSKHAKKTAYKIAKAIKNGDKIDVFYNPDKPEIAVLDRNVPKKLDFIIGLISIFTALHVVIMFKLL